MKGTVDYGKATLLALGASAVFFCVGRRPFLCYVGAVFRYPAFILVYALFVPVR